MLQTPSKVSPLRARAAAAAPTSPSPPMATSAVRGRRQASNPIAAAATSSATAMPPISTGLSHVPSRRTVASFAGVGAASTATEPTATSGDAAGRAMAAATQMADPECRQRGQHPGQCLRRSPWRPHGEGSEPFGERMGSYGAEVSSGDRAVRFCGGSGDHRC